jgi:aminotransferase EvaB
MTTRVWDYQAEYQAERLDLLDAVETVFDSGQLVLGANAIKLGLQALGVGPGDEVITVSNTAAPTVVAIDGTGATPVFVDVREDDFLMDTGQVAAAITGRTKCLLPVHLYGQCVDLAPLRELAAEHGLSILEDCAQAHGARQGGTVAGATGDAAAFSFYPTKVLGAYGDGGATITSDESVARRLRRLRYYGMEERYYTLETPAHNSRLDEVQAEILRRKLKRLDTYIAGRRAIARRYADGLGDTELMLPQTVPGNEHVYYVYVVRHPRRDDILERLKAYDIQLNISYPWPVHTMTGFAHLGYAEGALPVTEKLATEIFSLPMYPALSADLQDKVIHAVREVLSTL